MSFTCADAGHPDITPACLVDDGVASKCIIPIKDTEEIRKQRQMDAGKR